MLCSSNFSREKEKNWELNLPQGHFHFYGRLGSLKIRAHIIARAPLAKPMEVLLGCSLLHLIRADGNKSLA